VRGYADFAPLGHKVRVLREPEKGAISWKIRFRNGKIKEFTFPIRTTPWGSIRAAQDYERPDPAALRTQLLSHEPEALHIAALPTLSRAKV
jgi:adenylylsulfate reductase subunit B